MINLIPFTKYEFRLQGFVRATIYSNSIFIETLETVPEKIENLHGYIWNETSVVIHWTSPNSTNGPHFVRAIEMSKPSLFALTHTKMNICCLSGIKRDVEQLHHLSFLRIDRLINRIESELIYVSYRISIVDHLVPISIYNILNVCKLF
jgi:hypothetical protein